MTVDRENCMPEHHWFNYATRVCIPGTSCFISKKNLRFRVLDTSEAGCSVEVHILISKLAHSHSPAPSNFTDSPSVTRSTCASAHAVLRLWQHNGTLMTPMDVATTPCNETFDGTVCSCQDCAASCGPPPPPPPQPHNCTLFGGQCSSHSQPVYAMI